MVKGWFDELWSLIKQNTTNVDLLFLQLHGHHEDMDEIDKIPPLQCVYVLNNGSNMKSIPHKVCHVSF